MISIKKEDEIKKMQEGGHILSAVISDCLKAIKPGVSEIEIDELADSLIEKHRAKPGFKMVDGYQNATCISTNNIVVHGVPSTYKFNAGDVVGIDCGVFYKGLHTDMSESVMVPGNFNKEVEAFLKVGKNALEEAIKEAVLGNRVGHISKKIQQIVETEAGYSIVRSLVGHGVGYELHEDPEVPGFLDKKIEKTPMLSEGMTIAIEVIYNMGDSEVVYSNEDGWTISTRDGSLSGLFERSVAVTKNGPVILTI